MKSETVSVKSVVGTENRPSMTRPGVGRSAMPTVSRKTAPGSTDGGASSRGKTSRVGAASPSARGAAPTTSLSPAPSTSLSLSLAGRPALGARIRRCPHCGRRRRNRLRGESAAGGAAPYPCTDGRASSGLCAGGATPGGGGAEAGAATPSSTNWRVHAHTTGCSVSARRSAPVAVPAGSDSAASISARTRTTSSPDKPR